jgi:hypothetical protein
MKSEVFNGQRFWSYFKYDIVQMWRNHVKAAIGIGLAGLIFYFLCIFFGLITGGGWDGPNIATRFIVFTIAFIVLELYQTRTYGYLTDRRKGSAWLMVPASSFEKWLSMILITLIVIPVVFLAVFFGVDAILSLADPTVGQSMVASIAGGMTDVIDKILEVNGEYDTTWSLWAFAPSLFFSFCGNFLFFLLCGLIFRKNKILGGFVIILGLSILMSLVSSFIVMGSGVEYEDFAEAESAIRGMVYVFNWVGALIAAGLAGGVFWRIKTLKH